MKETMIVSAAKSDPTNAVRNGTPRVRVNIPSKGHPLNALSKEDWAQISDSVSAALAKVGISPKDTKIDAHVDGLAGSMSFDFLNIDAPGVSVTRSFFKDGDKLIAYHALLDLDEKLQGKGVSKGIISALLPAYEKMGVDRIEVHANKKVGGYTWARFGFKAEYRQAMRLAENIKGRSLAKKARAIVDGFYASHSTDEGFPVNLIASEPWGKKALLGSEWGGYVDLHDKRQVGELKRYASS